MNDLIFPEALPLASDYSVLLESDVPIVVQFARIDTEAAEKSWMGTTAWSG